MNNNLIIEEKIRMTPFVYFDFEKGVLLLQGYSMQVDPIPFYENIIEITKEFLEEAPKSVTFEMKLIYINSASFRKLLDLFCLFSDETVIKWFYSEEDKDLLDSGEIIASILSDLGHKVRFNFIETDDSS